jgi:hypothetical protein
MGWIVIIITSVNGLTIPVDEARDVMVVNDMSIRVLLCKCADRLLKYNDADRKRGSDAWKRSKLCQSPHASSEGYQPQNSGRADRVDDRIAAWKGANVLIEHNCQRATEASTETILNQLIRFVSLHRECCESSTEVYHI